MFEVDKTKTSPYILINYITGDVTIKGRSFMSSPYIFYKNLTIKLNLIQTLSINFNIQLDYCNTVSIKTILEFLKLAKEKFNININWYYDLDDEDMKNVGRIFENILQVDFNIIENS